MHSPLALRNELYDMLTGDRQWAILIRPECLEKESDRAAILCRICRKDCQLEGSGLLQPGSNLAPGADSFCRSRRVATGDEPRVRGPARESHPSSSTARTSTGLTTWLKDTKAADPRKVFRVADGVLHISGDGNGYVATEKEYRDYHLVVEYKWGQTDRRRQVRAELRASCCTRPVRTAAPAGRGCRRSSASSPRAASAT